MYQSKKDGKSYIEIDSTHLNKEFIYFSYIENGVTDAGAVKGSYRGSKIIKINKFYDKIDFTIENTSFYFDVFLLNVMLRQLDGKGVSIIGNSNLFSQH